MISSLVALLVLGSEPTITIAAVGDILLDRGVRHVAPARLFSDVAPVLRAADIAIGNLECPLTSRRTKGGKQFAFTAAPSWASALASSGLDVMNLANNHSLDAGRMGLSDTGKALRKAGVRFAGRDVVLLKVKDLRVVILSFCTFRDWAFRCSEDEMVSRVKAAAGKGDLVVVNMHWGVERTGSPTSVQRLLARRLVNAGADVILGSHPHYLQPVESVYVGRRRGLIAYSLGNFVFDNKEPEQRCSAILMVTLGKKGVVGWNAVPCVITGGVPHRAGWLDSLGIFGRLNGASGASKVGEGD